jgi:hypothetical protein
MVDDESGGVPQALRPEARVIAIAGHHQDIDTISHGAHHFALDAPATAEQLDIGMAETSSGGGKQLRRLVIGHIVVAAGGSAPGEAAPEEAGGRRVGDFGDIRGCDVQERESRIRGKVLHGSVDAALPGSLDNPDDDSHGRH